MNHILLGDQVGLKKVLKREWNSSGPKESLKCLDHFKHDTKNYDLSFSTKSAVP